MTLEQLRIFVAVAEREHLTEASRALNLTASAVSAAVAALEARYATPLFDRIGRRIHLTEAGRLFLIEARAVLARSHAAEAMLTDLAGLKRGRLALAASQTVAGYWLPHQMHHFQRQYPGIELDLRVGNTESVAAWVAENLADIGIVEGPVDNPLLKSEIVADDDMYWVGTSGAASRVGTRMNTAEPVESGPSVPVPSIALSPLNCGGRNPNRSVAARPLVS